MISFKRPRKQAATLSSTRAKNARAKIAAIIAKGQKPKSTDFDSLWGETDVRDTLWKMQRKKCCYCERLRDVARESDIEHFRPKAGITEEKPHSGYWWLAYSWANLLFACRYCNQHYKKNHFPLLHGGVRAKGEKDKLDAEQACLIDPSREDPERFIGFNWDKDYGINVFPYGTDGDGRGQRTIGITGLDRIDLNTGRAAILSSLEATEKQMKYALHLGTQSMIDEAADDILFATSSEREYAGFRRAYFRATGLAKYIAKD